MYGGGQLKSNAKLLWHAHLLFALYSGGEINLDHAGHLCDNDVGFDNYLGDTQGRGATSGGSGGGHGGTGGRGNGQTPVGIGYGSIYEPESHGGPGGYGTLFGKKKNML